MGGHAEVEGYTEGWVGGTGVAQALAESSRARIVSGAEQWGLGTDHTARFCRGGETSHSWALPRPSWGSTPIFAPKWGPSLPQPGCGRENCTPFRGLWGKVPE